MDKIPMTAEGYSALETELKHCQQVERPRIIQQITDARTHGDLSENAEYHAAKESQSLNEGRIAELEDKLARAEIIDVSKLSGDTIKFGATVTLVDEDTDKKTVWQIVGEPEADAKKGKISITSPVARALIGNGLRDCPMPAFIRLRLHWQRPELWLADHPSCYADTRVQHRGSLAARQVKVAEFYNSRGWIITLAQRCGDRAQRAH